jgi:three-Cys-motif partner protein
VSAGRDFFRERRAQAVFKHGILQRYPVVFAAKAGWGGRPVVFLDGYAGRGEYEDGSPGSPVLLSRTAARVADFRTVTGIYVERNEADFRNLQQVMARLRRAGDQVLGGDLRRLLPGILATARDAALFAFLDPFGTALDREQLVNQLLNRPGRAPTEVLLHISISTVARIGGLLRKRREEDAQLREADQKTIEHADRFLGGQWWHQHFEPVRDASDEERATVAAMRVAGIYQEGVRAEARCMSVSMPIRHKPGQLPKYLLVLFSRHLDGLWHFADAVGKAGREWEGAWRRAEVQQARARAARADADALFGAEELLSDTGSFDVDEYVKDHRAVWEQIIEDNIRRVLDTDGPFVLAERLDEVYAGVFGAASASHVRAAVKSLYRKGLVRNTGVGDVFYAEPIRLATPSRESH